MEDTWNMAYEKSFVKKAVKAIAAGRSPARFLSGYVESLDYRYYGFTGEPITDGERREMKSFALDCWGKIWQKS